MKHQVPFVGKKELEELQLLLKKKSASMALHQT
jgi:hypothetical protein